MSLLCSGLLDAQQLVNPPAEVEPRPEALAVPEVLPADPEEQALTPRQAAFVQEYIVDLNGTQAAIRAGYSPATANEQAARLLAGVSVRAAVEKLKAQRLSRVNITQDSVLHEMSLLASARVDWFYVDENGELRSTELAPEGAMACVASIKKRKITKMDKDDNITVTHEVEFKLWDKPGTLKLMGRHVGLFPDRVEVTGPGGKPIETISRVERVLVEGPKQ